VAGTVLASVPVNSEAGSYLTFAFPILLFCVIATVLYVRLFGRPHPRVPARRIAAVAYTGPPSPEAAQAAAVAGGLPIAEGGGSAESGAEAAGAVSAALAGDDPDSLPSADNAAPVEGTKPAEGTAPSDDPTANGGTEPTDSSGASE
jgi:hypothetical protein